MKEIKLTQGRVALVDDADFEWLSKWKWCAWTPDGKTFYAKRCTAENLIVYMHIAIFGVKGVDHKDRNGLNNQRNNLRAASKSKNGANRGPQEGNRSGLKGVSWHNRDSIFRARIGINRKEKHLGFFHDPLDAAKAYDTAAIKYFGEFACTNKSLGLL